MAVLITVRLLINEVSLSKLYILIIHEYTENGFSNDISECKIFDPEAIGSDIQYTYIQRLAHIMRHFTTMYVSKILKESCLATHPNPIESDW